MRNEIQDPNNISGIYKIQNKINNKVYIGQSGNIEQRWYVHSRELNKGIHCNRHLQAAWSKYGEDNFKFEIIERCPIDDLDEREIYWINYYDSFNNGYNLSQGGIGCRGYKHTEEEISKMRQIQKPDAVLQLDKELNFIKRWESASHAGKTLGLYSQAIKNCCNKLNHVKSVGGFVWIFEKDKDNFDKNYYLIINESPRKKIGQFDQKLNLIGSWDSVYSAGKELGLKASAISAVCNHRENCYQGYIWTFIDEDDNFIDDFDYKSVKIVRNATKVAQYNSTGEVLIKIYDSISQATKETGVGIVAIKNSCDGKPTRKKQYVWKYV